MRCSVFRSLAAHLLFAVAATVCLHAQWRPLDQPFGTDVYRLFEKEGTVLASSLTGVYRSDNGGESWVHIYPGTTVNARTFTHIGNRIYAGTRNGIIISDDDGRTWTQLQSDTPELESSVAAMGFDGSTLYAGGFGAGLYSSTDGGATWTADGEGLPNSYVSSIAVAGSSVFLALVNSFGAEDGGIFTRSTGGIWTRLTSIHPVELVAIGTALFTGTWEGAYRSEDGGATWIQLPIDAGGSYVTAFASTGSVLFAGTSEKGVFRSTDNGNTWVPAGLEFAGVRNLVVRGSALIAATQQHGVFALRDGGTTWEPGNTGIQSTTTISAMTSDGGSIYAVVEQPNELYKTSDGGTTWTQLPRTPSTTSTIVSLAVINSTLLAGTSREGVFNADVNGTSWQASSGIPARTWINGFFQSGSTILAGAYHMGSPVAPYSGAYVSRDIGLTWQPTDMPAPAYSFASHNGALYAGLTRDVMISTDGGEHWTKANTHPLAESDIYALASNGPTLFAGSYNHGVYISHDNGATWTASATGLPEASRAMSFAVYDRTVFAGTGTGVYKTEDNGATWESVAAGMESISVQALSIAGGYLYAGTSNAAVWRRPLSEITTTSVGELLPTQYEYSLLPHPLNSSSVLQLCSSCRLHNATLTLSTLNGQRVRTTPDLHGTSVAIEKGDLAPGVYAFTLEEAGRVVASGTIVVE